LICVFLQPDTVTGDIVFVLQQKEHPKFKRKGDDLFVEHTLSLTEALCGFQFILTHLDGRQLLIKSQPGEVVKPGKLISIMLLTCLVVYPQVLHLIEN
jgi:DnaJ family protein A protein 2